MKNKLVDLNNHLFVELERLNDEDLKGEALAEEISRAKAITGVASNIIENAKVVLEAEKVRANSPLPNMRMPAMLEHDK